MRVMVATVLLLSTPWAWSGPEEYRDGQVRQGSNGELQAWDKENSRWLGMEVFWQADAERRGGYTLGKKYHVSAL